MILRSLVPAAVPTVLTLTSRATAGIAGPADGSAILASHLLCLALFAQQAASCSTERGSSGPSAHHYYPSASVLPQSLLQTVLLQRHEYGVLSRLNQLWCKPSWVRATEGYDNALAWKTAP